MLLWFVEGGGCGGGGGGFLSHILQLWTLDSTNPSLNASKSRPPEHLNQKEEKNKGLLPKTGRGLNANDNPKSITRPKSERSGTY